jgi:DNA-binding response OmpR family regulator
MPDAIAPPRFIYRENRVIWHGGEVRLPPLEADLLAVLARAHGRVVEPDVILHNLYPVHSPADEQGALRVRICYLRNRLHGSGLAIRTIWGRGVQLIGECEVVWG